MKKHVEQNRKLWFARLPKLAHEYWSRFLSESKEMEALYLAGKASSTGLGTLSMDEINSLGRTIPIPKQGPN